MSIQLEELVTFVRQNVPQSKELKNLEIQTDANIVSFNWQGRNFVVKPSFEVFEMKATKVFITGASALMQLAFMKRTRNEKILQAVVDLLDQAGDLLKGPNTGKQGFSLLQKVKASLSSLIGKSISTAKPPLAPAL